MNFDLLEKEGFYDDSYSCTGGGGGIKGKGGARLAL